MKNEWIPLSEQKPTNFYEDVLVFTTEPRCYVASLTDNDGIWMTNEISLIKAGTVTHWQPLQFPENINEG